MKNRSLKKTNNSIWFWGTIVFGVFSLIMMSFAFYSYEFKPIMYIKKMFYNSDTGFNWTAITALVAVAALGFNWISTQNGIKANLVSKSRIEWIQNVRETTSKLLTAYSKLTNNRSRSEYLTTLEEIRLNGEVLKLYFGSIGDPSKLIASEEFDENVVLMNNESNIGKNSLIVSFIDNLVETYILEDKKQTFEEKLIVDKKIEEVTVKLLNPNGLDDGDSELLELQKFITWSNYNGLVSYTNDELTSKDDIEERIYELLVEADSSLKTADVHHFLLNKYDKKSLNEELNSLKKAEKESIILEVNDKVKNATNNLESGDAEYFIDMYKYALNDAENEKYSTAYVELCNTREEIIKFIESLNKDLKLLGTIIRLYLKIEWDIAKSGE